MGKKFYGLLEGLNEYLEEHDHDSEVAAITLADGTEFDIDYRHRKRKASLIGTGNVLSKVGVSHHPLDNLGAIDQAVKAAWERFHAATDHPGAEPIGIDQGGRVVWRLVDADTAFAHGLLTPAQYANAKRHEAAVREVRSSDDSSLWDKREVLENSLNGLFLAAGDLPQGFDPAAVQARVLMDNSTARGALIDALLLAFPPQEPSEDLEALMHELEVAFLGNQVTPTADSFQDVVIAARRLVELYDNPPEPKRATFAEVSAAAADAGLIKETAATGIASTYTEGPADTLPLPELNEGAVGEDLPLGVTEPAIEDDLDLRPTADPVAEEEVVRLVPRRATKPKRY